MRIAVLGGGHVGLAAHVPVQGRRRHAEAFSDGGHGQRAEAVLIRGAETAASICVRLIRGGLPGDLAGGCAARIAMDS
jgi:hypothetical protein